MLSRFPTATLWTGAGHLSPTFCCSCRHRNSRLLSVLHVRPFVGRLGRLLRPQL